MKTIRHLLTLILGSVLFSTGLTSVNGLAHESQTANSTPTSMKLAMVRQGGNLTPGNSESLEITAAREAGHIIAAKAIGVEVEIAKIYPASRSGTAGKWCGVTMFRSGYNSRGLATAKLGGLFAQSFVDPKTKKLFVPSFLDVVADRQIISRSDRLNQIDLGAEPLHQAQHRAYRALTANLEELHRVYDQLRTQKAFP